MKELQYCTNLECSQRLGLSRKESIWVNKQWRGLCSYIFYLCSAYVLIGCGTRRSDSGWVATPVAQEVSSSAAVLPVPQVPINAEQAAAETNRAVALLTNGDMEGALAILQRVVSAVPSYQPGAIYLGIALIRYGDDYHLTGQEILKAAIKIAPDTEEAKRGQEWLDRFGQSLPP